MFIPARAKTSGAYPKTAMDMDLSVRPRGWHAPIYSGAPRPAMIRRPSGSGDALEGLINS
jgi:hypothetical protein